MDFLKKHKNLVGLALLYTVMNYGLYVWTYDNARLFFFYKVISPLGILGLVLLFYKAATKE